MKQKHKDIGDKLRNTYISILPLIYLNLNTVGNIILKYSR